MADRHDDDAKPAGPQKRYLTKQGFDRFAAEHRELWNVERRKVVQEVATAAAHGDRSENAEYIYGKRRLREIDRRLGYLAKLLEGSTVIDPATRPESKKVLFGSWVTVEDEDGHETAYQLVGRDEVDARAGRISLDSPLGRLLLGKQVGDDFTFRPPKGDVELVVTRIANAPPPGWKEPPPRAMPPPDADPDDADAADIDPDPGPPPAPAPTPARRPAARKSPKSSK